MSIFVDASALVAMIAAEPEAELFSDHLGAEPERLCSAISVWETVAALCRTYQFSVMGARVYVGRFTAEAKLRYVSIGELEFEAASDAYARYGKGRHPAQLNMGDCFSYACARVNGARLLFKGKDFAKTDIDPAIGGAS